MNTERRGWTLVWSYTFTDYSRFTYCSNAITPRPNWQVNANLNVPISTTQPLNETDYNAMNFSQWKTPWQTDFDQEQHNQLADMASGNWNLG